MASLQRHVVQGRTYWRIVESRRVNGKPRPVPVLYLGTADMLMQRLLQASAGSLSIRSFAHGDVAALKAAADRLDVVSLIDKHIPGQGGSLSVGTTLLLGALNRAIRPRSKRGFAAWAADTSLPQLFPGFPVDKLSSQVFWNQMDRVSLEALRKIEGEICAAVVRELKIELNTLFYDTTNFFTYIASTNLRPKLPQRGKSKQRRADLRLFGLALLVSRDGQIPLCSQIYEGNKVDCKHFPDALSAIRQRLAELSVDIEQVTMVYDKGNLSRKNQAMVDDAAFGYVASLVPAHHRDLMAIPMERYRVLPEGGRLEGVPALRLTREIWGAERTVVLFISEKLREGQIRGLKQHLAKRIKTLERWKEQLAKPGSGPRSEESMRARIDELQRGQYLNEVLHVEYHAERSGAERLGWWVDEEAMRRLELEVFGKRLVVTNRKEWSTEDIVLAYQGQHHVEAVFRQLKDDEHLAVRPQHHWTDQKIHVHAFICLLALLLSRVVEREARSIGHRENLSGLLDLLGGIRLAMVLKPSGKKGGRPRAEWHLEKSDKDAVKLFKALVPDRPPFVYTTGVH